MSTATKTHDSPLQGVKLMVFEVDLTGSGTEMEITTGLNNVLFAIFNNGTTEAQGLVYKNFSDAGVTAKAGSIWLTGCTAADNGALLVLGN